MSEAVKAALQKLGSLVPGYAGYADREKRRESDQALRLSVAAGLGAARAALDRRTAECARTGRFDVLEPLDAVSRRVAALADAVRHAPAGYSALFDAATVDAAGLDRLYELDLEVQGACERLVEEAERLPAAVDPEALGRVQALQEDAEAALRRRTESLRGVK
ncbi:MAG: hypothetical protein KJ062_11835 [Thermoanaerobaculia bacterium]|nr:hypothetical protein [Thermoanaerobaculia bacterium]